MRVPLPARDREKGPRPIAIPPAQGCDFRSCGATLLCIFVWLETPRTQGPGPGAWNRIYNADTPVEDYTIDLCVYVYIATFRACPILGRKFQVINPKTARGHVSPPFSLQDFQNLEFYTAKFNPKSQNYRLASSQTPNSGFSCVGRKINV